MNQLGRKAQRCLNALLYTHNQPSDQCKGSLDICVYACICDVLVEGEAEDSHCVKSWVGRSYGLNCFSHKKKCRSPKSNTSEYDLMWK